MLEKNILKKLYLEEFHINNKAKFVPFAGYNMPLNYVNDGIIAEHLNTRLNCGLFDVSHMLQICINIGENIINKLEKIIPLDLKNLPIGESKYSFILNKNGGIIDDLIISKLNDKNDFFYIVLNASRRQNDLNILSEILGNKNLIIERGDYSLLSLQGPKARKILINLLPEVKNLKFMKIIQTKYKNNNIIISCSGYTGEDGFELSISNNIINQFVEELIKNNDIKLCGLGCRDTLRIEAGLCLYGNELDETISPKDANLMWCIPKSRIEKKDFIGADKFINNKSTSNFFRIGLESLNNSIPRSNLNIYNDQNKLIGKITSGSFSPSLKKPIAMGIIDKKFSNIDTKVFFELRNKMEKAIICKLPFVSHKYFK